MRDINAEIHIRKTTKEETVYIDTNILVLMFWLCLSPRFMCKFMSLLCLSLVLTSITNPGENILHVDYTCMDVSLLLQYLY